MQHLSFLRRLLGTALLAGLTTGALAQAQNVGIGTTAPNPKAALEIAASDKGLLIPRLDSVQRTGISSPPQGLMVYQTDGRAGLWYYQGGWQFLKPGNQADNLGNHTATQNLNLGANALTGTGASISGVGIGVRADGGLNIGQNTTGNNVYLGYQSGAANTTGSDNHFSGYQSGAANTTGFSNYFSGNRSGAANTTGARNYFSGYLSGVFNTIGSDNLFIGNRSGWANTTGSDNYFSGNRSGFANITGYNNYFSGNGSGFANTTGYNNYFSGNGSGSINATGINNHFSGYQSGFKNANANGNQFVGFQSGYNNSAGNNNHFDGFQSGFSNTGGYNGTFSGHQSGYSNTTGDNNHFNGYRSGYSNTSGWNNYFSGYQSGLQNTTGHKNHFSGYQSGMNNTIGRSNQFIGYLSGLFNTTGKLNLFVGDSAGIFNTTGNRNYAFGMLAGPTTGNLTNAGAIGYNAQVSQSNSLVLGGTGADAVRVGIGTTAPAATLHVAGAGSSVRVEGLASTSTRLVMVEPSGNLISSPITLVTESTKASNGLNEVGDEVRLGGSLLQNTTIATGLNSLSITGATYAGPEVTDQSILPLSSGFGLPFLSVWQSFTPGSTGRLTKLEFFAANASSVPATVTIYADEGTGGPVLATQAAVVSTGSNMCVFSSPPLLTAGQVYTFQIQCDVTADFLIASNSYAGGRNNIGVNSDFAFRTFMRAQQQNATLTASNTGQVQLGSLAGTGTRMVTADASGNLAAQALPTDAQQLSISGSTISLTNGGSVVVPSSADNWGTQTAVVSSPLTGNGMSASPLGIQTASASQPGALSAADWTTFNNKLTTVTTAGAPFTGNGTSASPLGIATANSTTTGALSAADWTTFNNKGSFNLPSLTSGSVIFSNGTTLAQNNANLFWDNTNARLGLGTATPGQRLHVVGIGRFENAGAALQLAGTGSGSHAFMEFYSDGIAAGRRAYFGFPNNGTTELSLMNTLPSGTVTLGTNATTRVTVNSAGNVGIGATGPAALLEISGTGSFSTSPVAFFTHTGTNGRRFSVGSRTDLASNGTFAISDETAGQTRMVIDNAGYVGIGTLAPDVPLTVGMVNTNYTVLNYGFLSRTGTGFNVANSGATSVSIRATGRVVATEFNATSDRRLKNIIGLSDNAADLTLLNQLRITDYTMRDRVQHGDRHFKKVIAQEVEAVFPQAVHQQTGFLPDVYTMADAVTAQADTLVRVVLPKAAPAATPHQRLKLIGPQGEVIGRVVRAEANALLVSGARTLAGAKEVFVYGLEHPDVRSVDYEALSMLNVSATQELARQLEALRQENAALKHDTHAETERLRRQLDGQQAALQTMQQQMARLLGEAPAGTEARK